MCYFTAALRRKSFLLLLPAFSPIFYLSTSLAPGKTALPAAPLSFLKKSSSSLPVYGNPSMFFP
jgi:hypothetical protein